MEEASDMLNLQCIEEQHCLHCHSTLNQQEVGEKKEEEEDKEEEKKKEVED